MSDSQHIEQIRVWQDPVPRSGEQNMAIDELLMTSVSDLSVLRFYEWSEPTVSFGYFDKLAEAQKAFSDDENLNYVRRWTGGGVVDHRIDLTYTLVIPKSHPLANLRGAESYRIIHEAVASALNDQGVDCKVIAENAGDGNAACFENPVAFDIVCDNGNKLAGAGQKRSRYGLLHQGSVVGVKASTQWQKYFLTALGSKMIDWSPSIDLLDESVRLGEEKYKTKEWLTKR